MPVPKAPVARRFYHVALQRLEDGQILVAERPPAAIYLAGYAVECVLKALILSYVPPGQHAAFVHAEFRGAAAHDIGWLRQRLRRLHAASFPAEVIDDLVLVSTWSTELRYTPGKGDVDEAADFVDAVQRIIKFVEGRLS